MREKRGKSISKNTIVELTFFSPNTAENDKGENYYVIENIDVDRNLFHIIAIIYENMYIL